MLAQLFAVLAPVLITAGLGYGWARSGHAYPTDFIAKLVLNIATPCLILSTLSRAQLDRHAFAEMAIACVLVTVAMGVVGFIASRMSGKDWRVLVPGFLFPNSGNMGLPMSLYAFGEHGLALAVAFFMVLSVGHFSIGPAISGSAPPLKKVFSNPILISLVLALPLVIFDIELPRWLDNSLDLLAGMTIPLMLLTLGVSLASIRVHHLGSGMLLGGLRILCGAGVGWLVGVLLGLPPLSLGVLVMQSAMPVAVFNYLFAVRANRSPEDVASLVLCSTLLSFVFLPLLLLWLLPASS
ncbi:AEC family transporter [Pseudomonas sp. PS02288]|uniref:AEC family transporter n=1 Tax=Pseudomonas sp. PS02288 TaxID=2991443 RepID=UPI00249BC1F3|nr:AEC family transporter [Pseudomonas sp. PS02288]